VGSDFAVMATKLPFLSDDHHFAIANVAANSATLDHVIDRLVYLTIEPHDVAAYLVKNVPADRLVEIIRLAFVAELQEHSGLIDALFKQIKKCRTERNHVLHWLHESTDKPDVIRFTDKRGGRQQDPRDYTATGIQKIADAMAAAYGELLEWWSLYNWHHDARLFGKLGQLTPPPHLVLPKSLRPPGKPRPRARRKHP
jgi:hypothetical protein